jgi:hypothetical protein
MSLATCPHCNTLVKLPLESGMFVCTHCGQSFFWSIGLRPLPVTNKLKTAALVIGVLLAISLAMWIYDAPKTKTDAEIRFEERLTWPELPIEVASSHTRIEIRNSGDKVISSQFKMILDRKFYLNRVCYIEPGRSEVFLLNDFADEDGNRFTPYTKKAKKLWIDADKYRPDSYTLR